MQTFSIAAAHLKIYINGQLLGYATAVPSWKVSTNWGRLRELDAVRTRQFAPRLYAVSGALQILRGRYTGGLEGAGLVPTAEAMLRQKYSTIEIVDRVSQEIIYRALYCVVDEQNWSITPKQLVVGTFSFEGMSFGTEAVQ